MENYVPKGYTFPDQDWWEEKKTDVSFLYLEDDDTLSAPECIVEYEENRDEGSEVVCNERQDSGHLKLERNESRDGGIQSPWDQSASSKLQLDKWIEGSRHEMKVPSRPTGIKTLAGYVNIAYPIMSSLIKRKTKGSRPRSETNRELPKRMQQVSANLQHVSDTLKKIQLALDQSNAQHSGHRNEALKKAFHRRSTRIVENYELINVLMNMVKTAANIPSDRKESSKISRTFSTSVDLI